VIRGISLFADGKYLTQGLPELLQVPGLRLGMHFNVTYGKDLPSPSQLLVRGVLPWRRSALRGFVRKELSRQYGLLRAVGVTPLSIEGHHHSHVFPGVTPEVLRFCKEQGIRELRLPLDPGAGLRSVTLLVLSLSRARIFRKNHIQTLPFFYPSCASHQDFGRLTAEVLQHSTAEVLFHPATHDDHEAWAFPDSYVRPRITEYHALRMLWFVKELTRETERG